MSTIYSLSGLKTLQDYFTQGPYKPSHEERFYTELEKEIQKYMSLNFVCAKVERFSNNGTESNVFYFLNENGSILFLPVERIDNSLGIWRQRFFPDYSIIKSWTKDYIIKSKFEGKDSAELKEDDAVVMMFKSSSFKCLISRDGQIWSNDRSPLYSFVNLCESLIEQRIELDKQKSSLCELRDELDKLKRDKRDTEIESIKTRAYMGAVLSSIEREHKEELRCLSLENNERIQQELAYKDALVSSIKREHKEEINQLLETQNKTFFEKISTFLPSFFK
jgi:hypothetical protein